MSTITLQEVLQSNPVEHVQMHSVFNGLDVVSNLQTILNASIDSYKLNLHQLTNNQLQSLSNAKKNAISTVLNNNSQPTNQNFEYQRR